MCVWKSMTGYRAFSTWVFFTCSIDCGSYSASAREECPASAWPPPIAPDSIESSPHTAGIPDPITPKPAAVIIERRLICPISVPRSLCTFDRNHADHPRGSSRIPTRSVLGTAESVFLHWHNTMHRIGNKTQLWVVAYAYVLAERQGETGVR